MSVVCLCAIFSSGIKAAGELRDLVSIIVENNLMRNYCFLSISYFGPSIRMPKNKSFIEDIYECSVKKVKNEDVTLHRYLSVESYEAH